MDTIEIRGTYTSTLHYSEKPFEVKLNVFPENGKHTYLKLVEQGIESSFLKKFVAGNIKVISELTYRSHFTASSEKQKAYEEKKNHLLKNMEKKCECEYCE